MTYTKKWFNLVTKVNAKLYWRKCKERRVHTPISTNHTWIWLNQKSNLKILTWCGEIVQQMCPQMCPRKHHNLIRTKGKWKILNLIIWLPANPRRSVGTIQGILWTTIMIWILHAIGPILTLLLKETKITIKQEYKIQGRHPMLV